MSQLPPNLPPMPVDQRTTVKIDYLDGESEVLEASGPLQMQGVFLIIPQPRDSWIAIAQSIIRRWEAIPCQIAVVRGAN
jgi:hypothetical protein